MQLARFLQKLKEVTAKTQRIKVDSTSWQFSGVESIPDEFIQKDLEPIVIYLNSIIHTLCESGEFLLIRNLQYTALEGGRFLELAISVKLVASTHDRSSSERELDLIVDTRNKSLLTSDEVLQILHGDSPFNSENNVYGGAYRVPSRGNMQVSPHQVSKTGSKYSIVCAGKFKLSPVPSAEAMTADTQPYRTHLPGKF